MQEIRSLASAIINHLSQMDIKASVNNLNRSVAIHNCVNRIEEILNAQTQIKATEIPPEPEEKKADKK